MKTKLFVLVGLSVVVLTSVFFAGNVFAQTMTTQELQTFEKQVEVAIRAQGFTPVIRDMSYYLSVNSNHMLYYMVGIAGLPCYGGNMLAGGEVSRDWTPETYVQSTLSQAKMDCSVDNSWKPGNPIPDSVMPVMPSKDSAYRAITDAMSGAPLPLVYETYTFVTGQSGWTETANPQSGGVLTYVPTRDIWGNSLTSAQIDFYKNGRTMTTQEIADFMKANPDYVNPYLIFTSGGVFGDPSAWTYQKHYWYDPTYQTHTGQPCPGDYCLGVADARRDPFTDRLTDGYSLSNPYDRIDSKGARYSVFPSFPSYIGSGRVIPDNLAKDALGFGEPYMDPDTLAGKLMFRAYPSYHVCEFVGGCEIGAYVRKAVHAYIIPKLPTYVAPPAPLSPGVFGGKSYTDAVSARQAYLKAAGKVVVDAVQQIQLQMGSASDEGVAARQFIEEWNKDPFPSPASTITPPPTTGGTGVTTFPTGTTISQTQYVNNMINTLNTIIQNYKNMLANVPTTSGGAGAVSNPPISGGTDTMITGFPAIITVTAGTLNVRSAPTTSAPLSGSRTLHAGDQFVAVEAVTGDNVEGESSWWKSSLGNYVWSGGTIQKSPVN